MKCRLSNRRLLAGLTFVGAPALALADIVLMEAEELTAFEVAPKAALAESVVDVFARVMRPSKVSTRAASNRANLLALPVKHNFTDG